MRACVDLRDHVDAAQPQWLASASGFILAFSRSKDQRFGGAARCVPSGNVVRRAAYLTHVVAYRIPKIRFIEPCRPSNAIRPPSGPLWVHESSSDAVEIAQLQKRDGIMPHDVRSDRHCARVGR